MKNQKLISVSILILALSLFGGLFWIGASIEKAGRCDINTSTARLKEKGLITEAETAEYLSITVDELEQILLQDSKDKDGLSSYSTYRFVPYIELESGVRMFSTKELDEWITHNMHNKYR